MGQDTDDQRRAREARQAQQAQRAGTPGRSPQQSSQNVKLERDTPEAPGGPTTKSVAEADVAAAERDGWRRA